MDIFVNALINHYIDLILKPNGIDRARLRMALASVKKNGVLGKMETREFAICGFPIISIVSKYMKVDPETAVEYISKGQISYSDLCCIIGTFAQELKLQEV